MTGVIPTLNATVAEIEDGLKRGTTVPDLARELQEPPANVYAVYRDLVGRGVIEDGKTSGRPAKAAVPVTPTRSLASAPPVAQSEALSVDALVNAAARSTSKRTQALGVRFADLAGVIRKRLADERDAAEKAERVKAEREAAAAEVARLEKQLREAKAKLGKGRGGSGSVSRPEKAAGGHALAAKYAGKSPCAKGCGRSLSNQPGPRSRHENTCAGAS